MRLAAGNWHLAAGIWLLVTVEPKILLLTQFEI